MNKTLLKSLLLSALTCTGVSATLESGSTFIAHRDDLANIAMEWTNTNHLGKKKAACAVTTPAPKGKPTVAKPCVKPFGAEMTVTGFYGQSTNKRDLAYRFGIGSTEAIKVTGGVATTDTLHTALYNTDVIHSPNSDGTSLNTTGDGNGSHGGTAYDRIPAKGTVNLAPKRQVYGVHIGWNQSLDSLLDGLAFTVRAPIVQVRSSMNPTIAAESRTSIPGADGKSGTSLLDYFTGNLTNSIDSTNVNVNQTALNKSRFGGDHDVVTGLADLEFGINYGWSYKSLKSVQWNLGALLQVPAGKKPDGVHLFESQYGARGHIAAGANASMHTTVYKKNDIIVDFDVMANWKYFFKGTEVRTMGIYDLTNKVMLPASQYRCVMTHGLNSVQPAANVLTVEHDVTPGHQVDALAGFTVSWKNFTFDLGYNLYWHQAEKVVQKAAWTNDKFAIAHPHYSMRTTDLGYDITGGTFQNNDDVTSDIGIVDRASGLLVRGTYNDSNSPVTKHQNYIGANGDAGNQPYVITHGKINAGIGDNKYPGAFTSINGPIQKAGSKTSALAIRVVADTDNGIDADATGEGAGTLAVRYNVSSLPATTALQLTHSIVAGASYKVPGDYPIVIGVGGQAELQESSRNSALEGFKVWAKLGIAF